MKATELISGARSNPKLKFVVFFALLIIVVIPIRYLFIAMFNSKLGFYYALAISALLFLFNAFYLYKNLKDRVSVLPNILLFVIFLFILSGSLFFRFSNVYKDVVPWVY
jgi:energy-coupling factor transporter transmembrane protein EcfT